MGESGSGKSAVGMAILRLLPGEADVLSGEVNFEGRNILSLTEHELRPLRGRRIAMIFQDPVAGLNPVIDIGSQGAEMLTSHVNIGKKEARIQAVQILRDVGLRGADDAVFLGDFNFGDGWTPETGQLDPKFTDLCSSLRPSEPGYTWNIEVNPMAKSGPFPNEKSGRIDRILLRSEAWKPSKIEIVGQAPISQDDESLFPSDHFGLIGTLQWKAAD